MDDNAKARAAERNKPLPDQGWSHRVEVLRGGVIVPPATRNFTQEAGVLRANGSYCAGAALWRKNRPLTTPPAVPDAPEQLDGTWLWGGVLWRHFGHFLVESTGRLWPLNGLPEPIKGVVFIPKNPTTGLQVQPYQRDFFALAGAPAIHVADRALRVEKMFVPGQGFGLGPIVEGTPHMRHFMRSGFAKSVAPNGPDKLYISRSGLGPGRAKLLCEDHLDRLLEAEGYTVFHPQRHDIATQIARYKAAKTVIASEGSAIHLLAMVAPTDQKLAIVVRRLSAATGFIEQHAKAFTGNAPLLVDAIRQAWLPEGLKTRRHQISELDFAQTHSALQNAGFVGAGPAWPQPPQNEIEAAKAASFSDKTLLPVDD